MSTDIPPYDASDGSTLGNQIEKIDKLEEDLFKNEVGALKNGSPVENNPDWAEEVEDIEEIFDYVVERLNIDGEMEGLEDAREELREDVKIEKESINKLIKALKQVEEIYVNYRKKDLSQDTLRAKLNELLNSDFPKDLERGNENCLKYFENDSEELHLILKDVKSAVQAHKEILKVREVLVKALENDILLQKIVENDQQNYLKEEHVRQEEHHHIIESKLKQLEKEQEKLTSEIAEVESLLKKKVNLEEDEIEEIEKEIEKVENNFNGVKESKKDKRLQSVRSEEYELSEDICEILNILNNEIGVRADSDLSKNVKELINNVESVMNNISNLDGDGIDLSKEKKIIEELESYKNQNESLSNELKLENIDREARERLPAENDLNVDYDSFSEEEANRIRKDFMKLMHERKAYENRNKDYSALGELEKAKEEFTKAYKIVSDGRGIEEAIQKQEKEALTHINQFEEMIAVEIKKKQPGNMEEFKNQEKEELSTTIQETAEKLNTIESELEKLTKLKNNEENELENSEKYVVGQMERAEEMIKEWQDFSERVEQKRESGDRNAEKHASKLVFPRSNRSWEKYKQEINWLKEYFLEMSGTLEHCGTEIDKIRKANMKEENDEEAIHESLKEAEPKLKNIENILGKASIREEFEGLNFGENIENSIDEIEDRIQNIEQLLEQIHGKEIEIDKELDEINTETKETLNSLNTVEFNFSNESQSSSTGNQNSQSNKPGSGGRRPPS